MTPKEEKLKKEDKVKLEGLRGPAASLFGISEDIALDMPRLTIIGNRRLWLENHQGIIGYDSREVRVKVQGGMILVRGEQLKLPAISSDEIVVEGIIAGLQLVWTKEAGE